MSKWIKSAEQKPHDFDYILFVVRGNRPDQPKLAHVEFGRREFDHFENGYLWRVGEYDYEPEEHYTDDYVPYWMPLPDPPAENQP